MNDTTTSTSARGLASFPSPTVGMTPSEQYPASCEPPGSQSPGQRSGDNEAREAGSGGPAARPPMTRAEVRTLEIAWIVLERVNHLDALKVMAHVHFLERQIDQFAELADRAAAIPGEPGNVSGECRGLCGDIPLEVLR